MTVLEGFDLLLRSNVLSVEHVLKMHFRKGNLLFIYIQIIVVTKYLVFYDFNLPAPYVSR